MPSDAAANGLRRAFELVPQDFGVRLQLADWLIGRRRHREALVVLSPVAYSAHGGGGRDAAIAMIERIRGLEDGTEPWPDPDADDAPTG